MSLQQDAQRLVLELAGEFGGVDPATIARRVLAARQDVPPSLLQDFYQALELEVETFLRALKKGSR